MWKKLTEYAKAIIVSLIIGIVLSIIGKCFNTILPCCVGGYLILSGITHLVISVKEKDFIIRG